MIAAILRAQWLSMRLRLGSHRRGAIFSILTALLWYGFWVVLAFVAEQFAEYGQSAAKQVRALPIGLMLIFLYWQLAPLISASLGASLDLKKLMVYPVPHRKLFDIEVLLRLTTCAEMLLVLAGSLTGLLRNPVLGGIARAPRLVTSYLLFVLFNLLLAAGVRSLLERLLSHKRLREILMLVLISCAALPRLAAALRAPL